MRAAVLAFDTDELSALAREWNSAGLTGPYIACDLRTFTGTRADADHEWLGTLLGAGGATSIVDGPVSGILSDLQPARVVVACVRGTDGSDGSPAAMVNLINHIRVRALDAHHEVRVEGLDLVFPQRTDGSGPVTTNQELDAFTLPESQHPYRRIIVSPEDSAAPGQPDAGVDDENRDSVALHTALAVLGVLGGYWTDVELQLDAETEHPLIARSHSRLVAGGKLCHDQAADFVAHRLRDASRADCEPKRFRTLSGRDGATLQNSSIEALRGKWRGVATYAPVALDPWSAPPRVSLLKHITLLLGFLPFALGVVLRGWSNALRQRSARAAQMVESEDLGYSVSDLRESRSPDWWLWQARDQRMAEQIRVELGQQQAASSGMVNPQVFIDLTRLATGLCDGAQLPVEVPGLVFEERRQLLLATDVAEDLAAERIDGAAQLLPPAAESSDDGDADVPPVTAMVLDAAAAELREAEPVRPGVLAQALRWTCDTGEVPIAPAPLSSQVIQSAVELAQEENEDSRRFAAARSEALRTAARPSPPTVLGGLRARTLSDLLRAATDAERWTAAATGDTLIDPERLERRLARYARFVRVMLVIALAIGLFWYFQGAEIMNWVNQRTDLDWSAGQVAAVATAVFLVVLLLVTAGVHRTYSAEAERARRLTESRARARAAASDAIAQRNRMRVVDRVMALWSEILSWSLLGFDASGSESDLSDAGSTRRPVAMQLALPVMESHQKRQMDRALTEAATPPGWRLQWLNALVEASGLVDVDAEGDASTTSQTDDAAFVDRLAPDDGLGRTPLREVQREAVGPESRRAVARLWIGRLDEALTASYFSDEDCKIEAPYVALGQFRGEWGQWFRPLRSKAEFRYLLDPTVDARSGRLGVTSAEYPAGTGSASLSSGDDEAAVAVERRSPGITALRARLEAVLLEETSLRLVEKADAQGDSVEGPATEGQEDADTVKKTDRLL